LRSVKNCMSWLIENESSSIVGNRSGNKVYYSKGEFNITYKSGDSEILSQYSIFDGEDWYLYGNPSVSWDMARKWMEAREGINVAILYKDEYVIQSGQLRKIDPFSNRESYTLSYFKTKLTNPDWTIKI